jgi:hypothetical protein
MDVAARAYTRPGSKNKFVRFRKNNEQPQSFNDVVCLPFCFLFVLWPKPMLTGIVKSSAADPDWIRIQRNLWIRIQEGKNNPTQK